MPAKMKFCSNLSFMFTAEAASILERYGLAKQAGFKTVESGFPFGFSVEQVAEAKNRAGLDQVLINLYTGDVSKGEVGVAAIPGKEEEFRRHLDLTIEYAKALRCRKIHLMAGKVEGRPEDKHWQAYEANLKYAAERLSTENIVGLIEPICTYTISNYLMDNFDRGLDIVKRVNSPHLRLQLDLFHLQHIAGDLTHNIEKVMPYVGHIQVAQVPLRDEPGNPGEINYEYIFKILEESDYKDFIGLEYKPSADTKKGLQWLEKMGFTL